jgi:curved DNA-binding protein CbpA
MPGFLGRFTRPRLSVADRHKLLFRAVELLHTHPPDLVEATLEQAGASGEEARALTQEALRRQQTELLKAVRLPASAREPVNYYFLLGVTPKASLEEIRRAYRRKARQVHPDQHSQEFSQPAWTRLMALVSDAHTVLTDPLTRRAYDIVWRERSSRVAAANRRQGEMRGDWETRYRWTIAEMSTIEDAIAENLEALAAAVAGGAPPAELGAQARRAVREYEDAILQVRTETYGLPAAFDAFAEQVRREMQRKEKLVPPLRRLAERLPTLRSGTGPDPLLVSELTACSQALAVVQHHQHLFDVRAAGLA